MLRTPLASIAAIGSALSVAALAAPLASAQSIEFRVIERTGRSTVTGTSSAQLNFAVQARATGATPFVLDAFTFNIHLLGEPESSGTLLRGPISNSDGTYVTTLGTSAAIGRGGLAVQFSNLASLSASFNGLINSSAGTFTNTPDQEIGLIAGLMNPFSIPDFDADGDGNPDTYTGPASPPWQATAPFDLALSAAYLASTPQWIDVYRFRYTVSEFTPRTLVIALDAATANAATELWYQNYWLARTPFVTGAYPASLAIGIGSAPTGLCCDVHTGACTLYIPGSCDGSYLPGTSCLPDSCPLPGSCCSHNGNCTVSPVATCTGTWTSGGSCSPSLCPPGGACCLADGRCQILIQSICPGAWSEGAACVSGGCTPFGRCCIGTVCTNVHQADCAGTYTPNVACTVYICYPPGACCSTTTGACTTTTQPACTGAWSTGTCSPSPCPPRGRCCLTTGVCSFIIQSACTGAWAPGSLTSCTPNPCPQPGICCAADGSCTVTFATNCAATWSSVRTSCTTNICPQLGACCIATSCTLTLASSCFNDGRVFQGPNTSCGPTSNRLDCCPANFNRVDGITMQDLLDYLSAWFDHLPSTDFNHDNSITLTDLIQFMNAWTAGCH